MELKDFISLTLQQIAVGVREAQQALDDQGIDARINPNVRGFKGPVQAIKSVEFDVAITAREGSESKAGAGIVVGPVALGGRSKSEIGTESVSRVRFSVPIGR